MPWRPAVVAACLLVSLQPGLAGDRKPGAAPRPATAGELAPLDEAAFWKLLAGARAGARDDAAFVERMAAALRKLGPEELVAYERRFDLLHAGSYGWRLWGAAYLIQGGCSDDGFEYFRAWLVAQGRRAFERAVADPDSLAALEVTQAELEDFWYLAPRIYQQKTGRPMPRIAVRRPTLGEQWDFDDPAQMRLRYPRLFAKYRGG